MSFPRYEKYRDSGVEWLGPVPAHWEVLPVKRVLISIEQGWSPQCEGSPAEEGHWGVLKVGCVNGGRFDPNENKALPPALEPMPELAVRKDDVLVSRANTRDLVGSVALVPRNHDQLLLCDKLYRLRVVRARCDPAFLALVLSSSAVRRVIESAATGASSSMLNIGQSSIIGMAIPLPPVDEQRGLVLLVARETAKIDALVEEQQRLIELLKEKRQAVISHAVTKGLNPNAPMKESGVEWLGEVPAHWITTKLKFLTSHIFDCPHETPVYSDDGEYSVIRTADLSNGVLDLSNAYKVDAVEYLRRVRRSTLVAGDIVYGREGERWGHAALVPPSPTCCLGQRMMQFRA